MIWFTVRLEDRPGALARLATALGERGINIGGIVGIAEDTDGELMLQTSDPARTREALQSIEVAFEEHAGDGEIQPDGLTIDDVRRGRDTRATG